MFKQKSSRWTKTRCYLEHEYETYDKPPKKVKYYAFSSIFSSIYKYKVCIYTGFKHEMDFGAYWKYPKTTNERRQWYNYMDELKDNGLVLHKNRRSEKTLPNAWDDYFVSFLDEHEKSWKSHTKCKKQWMKNLK